MYVDDMLIIGKKKQIQEFATMIQKEFSVKIQHNLADYLGCEFHMNKEKTRGWLGQLSIIKSLEQKFGKRAMKERLSMTPGTPRFTARRLENEEDKMNAKDHETYRSGVGTLLYLTKHSRPDISNPVRELSKTMDAPAQAHLDNVGAIWLSNNRNTGDRTKHIDIRTSFVKEYQEDGKIIIKFVKTKTMRQTYLPRIQATSFFRDTKRN